jgi:hypothetical protein
MKGIIAGILILFTLPAVGQQNILDDSEIQHSVQKCLYATYGFAFEEALEMQALLQEKMPRHPAPYFLKALIIYWKNFPLLPEDPETELFESYMNQSIDLAGRILEKEPDHLEGIFFDLHARAFKAMFWADNGKPGKVLFDINNMYRQTLAGIALKDKFNEFYFSSGLYNYYIEAYVELHPAYKPIVVFFRDGNKERGLQELKFAAENTTYIKYESVLFLSLLYLNYEKEMETALDYAAILYNNFPRNIYYTGQYLILLMHNSKYTVASVLNEQIDPEKSEFHRLIYLMTQGFLYENSYKDLQRAEICYHQAILIAQTFGPIADLYAAISYAGLSRIAEKKGNSIEGRRYQRQSRQHSGFDFILESDSGVSR